MRTDWVRGRSCMVYCESSEIAVAFVIFKVAIFKDTGLALVIVQYGHRFESTCVILYDCC